MNNVGIKPWKAETFKLRAEYYFERVGQFSIGGFRRNYTNFWQTQRVVPTPEFLENYGIDPNLYGGYEFFTQVNQPGTYSLTGFDVDYRQALTFLPQWARGVQVFGNASAIRQSGADLGSVSFAGFIPRIYSWGISLTRPKWNARVNWNYRGRQRNASVTGVGIESGTFNYASKRMYVDVLGEYYFWKRVGFFFNLRNVGDATEDVGIYGPSTPEVAQFRQRIDYASLWTFGIKGTW